MDWLQYPFTPQPRVAILGLPDWPRNSRTRGFPAEAWDDLEQYRPEALAGWSQDLRLAGEFFRQGALSLPRLAAPLVVFSSLKRGILNDAEIRTLWHLFGLPVYEQIRDGDSRLLAYECDARQGFHVVETSAFPHSSLLHAGVCACGWQGIQFRIRPAA